MVTGKSVPDLYPYIVPALGVVDAHIVTEYPLQPVLNLGCKGNLRQQVENLPALAYLLFDKMDIYLGLAA